MTRKRLFIIKGKAKWLKIDEKPKTKLPEGLKRIVAYRSEFYGETVVSFFTKQEGNNSENCSVPG